MKILYVTPLVAGFEDILNGKTESRGLPSFIFPLRELLRRGHQTDIILISDYNKAFDIKADWISADHIIANINHDLVSTKGIQRTVNKVCSFIELLYILAKCLGSHTYDFVYCHGTAALTGNLMANLFRVRCGYRIYGTVNLINRIQKYGRMKTMLLSPVYTAIFNLRKEFMIITDDGTHGDQVYDQLCFRKKYKSYFWLNGVDKEIDYGGCRLFVPEKPYLFHAARICRNKVQHRDVMLLRMLHKKGRKLHLYFAGHIVDEKYRQEMEEYIDKNDLKGYVTFLGDIKREDLQNYAVNAVAVPLFDRYSNQGNVFLECAMAGAVIITYHEKPLERFIKNGENGYFVHNGHEACRIIESLCDMDKDARKKIAEKLKIVAGKTLLSWDERVRKEIQLIETAVIKEQNSR